MPDDYLVVDEPCVRCGAVEGDDGTTWQDMRDVGAWPIVYGGDGPSKLASLCLGCANAFTEWWSK